MLIYGSLEQQVRGHLQYPVVKNMSKCLIVNADDVGYSVERNRGIVECFLSGAVSSVSLLVNGLAAEDATVLIKQHNIPTGLHLNLTEGRPVCQPGNIRSLLGKNGFFLGKFGFRRAYENGTMKLSEVKLEIQAQINEFYKLLDVMPTHMDGHQHIHVIPGISDIFASLMRDNDIRVTRLPLEDLDPHHAWQSIQQKRFMDEVIEYAKSAKFTFTEFGISFSDYFCGLQSMGSDMTVKQIKRQLNSVFGNKSLRTPQTNIQRQQDRVSCEMMVHPGYMTKEDGGCGDGPDDFSQSSDRENEMSVLTNPQIFDFYKELDIQLVSFKDFGQ